MLALEAAVATGQFEEVRNALETSAELFDRDYADEERRARTEQAIKSSWKSIPITVRIDLLLELSASAAAHGDRSKALALVDEARLIVDGTAWTAEHHVPLLARIARARHRAGAAEQARTEADEALALYESGRARIVDIERADALRPLAEAYHALGDTATASKLYRTAVEEGVANPNSRPRAEDLSATCSSMALHGVEPDAELMARMIQIAGALGPPW
jgi:tetratricopeptide (TPR) repeat protein